MMNLSKGKMLAGAMLILILQACQKPMADFLIPTQDRLAPTKIQFDNVSKNADRYEWDFGDGSNSSNYNAEHQYSKSGRYIVQLKAYKGNKASTMSKEIFLKAPNNCHILMETSMGNMTFRLSDATPDHRDNFIKLTKENYYQDLLFHRVIQGFMLQGGDPNSKNAEPGTALGTGGPGYTIKAEFVDSLAHVKGALAAARTGGPSNPEKRSSGSQFYIVQGKSLDQAAIDQVEERLGIKYGDKIKEQYIEKGGTPFLDQNYTVFGSLVDGEEVLDKIASLQTDQRDRPTDDVKILKISVIE